MDTTIVPCNKIVKHTLTIRLTPADPHRRRHRRRCRLPPPTRSASTFSHTSSISDAILLHLLTDRLHRHIPFHHHNNKHPKRKTHEIVLRRFDFQKRSLVGVQWRKCNKYAAEIRDPIEKKRVSLGTFKTAEEAAEAYLLKKIEIGEKMSVKLKLKLWFLEKKTKKTSSRDLASSVLEVGTLEFSSKEECGWGREVEEDVGRH